MSIYITRISKKEATIANKLSAEDGWPGLIQHPSTEMNNSNISLIIEEDLGTWPENNGPTSITLENVISSLEENIDTSSAIKLADIILTDPDEYGTNIFYLYGTDSVNFFIANNGLYLKENISLDYETKNAYNITIQCQDRRSRDSSVSVAFSLSIQDIQE